MMKEALSQKVYDDLADSYAAVIDTKPHNAFYDRPAIQSLVPELRGLRVLDAGCGPGVYTEWMLSRGAQVTGIDSSEKMLSHARTRNKDRADFFLANLEEPLDFLDDGIFDGIISPLTITYCRNLKKTFAEFSRVLKGNGWLVFSTEHPFFSYRYNNIDNYYKTKEVSCTWNGFDKPVRMKSYYHSLGNIMEALSGNGFLVEKILEPLPAEDFRKFDQEGYNKLLKFPLFIFVRACKRP